jgi:hypothetical protein
MMARGRPDRSEKAASSKAVQVTFRVPIVDLDRADQEVERLGLLGFSRADVLRIAIAMGLDRVADLEVPSRTRENNGKEKAHGRR